MLRGIDVSHHNSSINLKGNDFVIVKATEGTTFKDNKRDYWRNMAEKSGISLHGFYHYARPEKNNYVDEANHFVNTIAKYIPYNNTILALDWENVALKHDLSWAIGWLNTVEQMTGVKPLFYCQASYTPKIGEIYKNGNGLWVAHYTSANKPRIGAYPYWAIWQYTSSNGKLDKDYFNGTREQFLRYCRVH